MLSEINRQKLLGLAHESIEYGLKHRQVMPINLEDYDQPLRDSKATFVTLNINHQLRGCIGTLQAYRPLVVDCVEHAYAAAFEDRRFNPLSYEEYSELSCHISILGVPELIGCTSEIDLIQKLRPGMDGLILEEGSRRGTFLPSVWESLPDPKQFLRHLKAKAGLPASYWSDSLQVSRYCVESFADPE